MKILTFVGHGHTGHTPLAAIFDSHKNVAISNTYGKLDGMADIIRDSKKPDWSVRYPFDLPGQGEWDEIKVLGHTTINALETFGCDPVRIGCFRNPIHVIESRYHKMKNRIENPMREALGWYIHGYEIMATEADITLGLHQWTQSPGLTLLRLCNLLEIAPYDSWITNAVNMVLPIEEIEETSPDVPWNDLSQEDLEAFEEMIGD